MLSICTHAACQSLFYLLMADAATASAFALDIRRQDVELNTVVARTDDAGSALLCACQPAMATKTHAAERVSRSCSL